MTLHHITRKLLPLEERHNPNYSPTHSPSKAQERDSSASYTSASSTCCYNNLKLNPPFDSAMALTVLVLLTALFFMGFFSIYIRRFADESSVDPTRRRRGSSPQSSPPTSSLYVSRSRDSSKGVDSKVVSSLPVHAYSLREGKQGRIEEMECVICLSEFEEKDWIKEIPYCGHVFHVECIDTWLSSHVTCPLCRTAKLLVEEAAEKEVVVMVEGHVEDGEERGLSVEDVESSSGGEVRLVVNGGDTWSELVREVGPINERRSTSCVWFGERVRLHRSLSF